MPRGVHVQIGSQFRPQLGQDLLAVERVAIGIMVQVFHHLGRNQGRVLRRPRTRRIFQDAKLDRQPVAMRFDISVYAPRIGLEVSAILRRRNLNRLPGGHSEPQNPLLPVVLEKFVAQNLGDFAGCESPHHVHLPQAVLRSHKSLRKKKIVKTGSINRRHAVLIADHRDSGGETGNLQGPVQLGQGRARDGVGPDQRSQRHDQGSDQKERECSPDAETAMRCGNGSRGRGHRELSILWSASYRKQETRTVGSGSVWTNPHTRASS